jgi:hypothetical protein
MAAVRDTRIDGVDDNNDDTKVSSSSGSPLPLPLSLSVGSAHHVSVTSSLLPSTTSNHSSTSIPINNTLGGGGGGGDMSRKVKKKSKPKNHEPKKTIIEFRADLLLHLQREHPHVSAPSHQLYGY